jgi:hypothetical protein
MRDIYLRREIRLAKRFAVELSNDYLERDVLEKQGRI